MAEAIVLHERMRSRIGTLGSCQDLADGLTRVRQLRFYRPVLNRTTNTVRHSAAGPDDDAGSRDRLIRAAARLFAEHGFDGVSVRQIAAAAEANSALVGYYFRGKEGLLFEVYRALSEPLTEERMRRLEACSARGKAPALEQVIEAFVRPALDATTGQEGQVFTRLRAMLAGRHSDLLERVVAERFDASTTRFVDVLSQCLPHLTRAEVFWRFHFLLGAIYYTAAGPHRVRVLSRGACDPADAEAVLPELVRYAASGFRAPSGVAPARPKSRASVARVRADR
jgi:AcrR family transcriptional regulator